MLHDNDTLVSRDCFRENVWVPLCSLSAFNERSHGEFDRPELLVKAALDRLVHTCARKRNTKAAHKIANPECIEATHKNIVAKIKANRKYYYKECKRLFAGSYALKIEQYETEECVPSMT